MKTPKKTMVAALLAAAFFTGCADGLMAPPADLQLIQAEAKGAKQGPKTGDNGSLLQWKDPLARDVSESVQCEASFPCVIWLREVNSWITIPAGALSERTEITMTAVAGRDVNFVFAPHGTSFAKDVTIVVDQVYTTGSGAKYVAKYWVDSLSNVVEEIPAGMVWGFIAFPTDHFSGYALVM